VLLIIAALGKIGVFALVGKFVDLTLSESVEKRIQATLETHWLKLSYTTFPVLGRSELETAIAVSDSLAGKRLFSWRRLVTTLVVGGICVLMILILSQVVTVVRYWDSISLVSYLSNLPSSFADELKSYDFLTAAPVVFVSLFQGFSITRAASAFVLRASDQAMPSAFTLLLVFHLCLFVLWAPVGQVVQIAFLEAANKLDFAITNAHMRSALRFGHPPSPTAIVLSYFLVDFWSDFASIAADGWQLIRIPPVLSVRSLGMPSTDVLAIGTMAAYLTYGWRIGLTLLFLGSHLVGPLIQEPLLKYGEEVAEGRKGFFLTLFTVIGALIVGVTELMEAISKSLV
jgi:hypothetical protein